MPWSSSGFSCSSNWFPIHCADKHTAECGHLLWLYIERSAVLFLWLSTPTLYWSVSRSFPIYSELPLSALTFFSNNFPCNVQRLYIEQSCFLGVFPSGVQRIRLTTFPLLDDSVYVRRLSLTCFVSIFSCSSMDFGFSLTSVIFPIFALLCTTASVWPRYVFCSIFPYNLQRFTTNPLCFSASPIPSKVPRFCTEQVTETANRVAIMYPNITTSPRLRNGQNQR